MKKKLIIASSLILAIAVAILGLSTYQHHQQQEKAKQEREKYENYDYYTGQWEIDSYKFLVVSIILNLLLGMLLLTLRMAKLFLIRWL